MKPETLNGRTKYLFDGTTIIYCPTKKKTEEVSNVLVSHGVTSEPYHAGLPFNRRQNTHYKFMRDELNCIVATVAFGMGIDKPDIRLVIHYGAPKDIESYYQEIGRAGRDGQQARCCTFYNNADFAISRHFLNEIKNPKFKEYKNEMIVKMEQYLMMSSCRRKAIISHFDENVQNVGGTKICCDNCKRRLENPNSFMNQYLQNDDNLDFGVDVKLLIKAIQTTGDGRYGLSMPILLLRGSNNQKLHQRFRNLNMHGAGQNKTEKYWKSLGRQLISIGMLVDQPIIGGFGSTVATTKKASTFMDANKGSGTPSFIIKNPNKDMIDEMRSKLMPDQVRAEKVQVYETNILPVHYKENAWSSDLGNLLNVLSLSSSSDDIGNEKVTPAHEKELHMNLISVRRVLARKLDIPPYMVATNKNLLDMAQIRPSNINHLMTHIDGISERLCQRFGQSFIEEINSFCDANKISKDKKSKDSPAATPMSSQSCTTLQRGDGYKTAMTPTVLETYTLYKDGKTVNEICTLRSFVEDTIQSHLATALKSGYPVAFDRMEISEEDISRVMHAVRSKEIGSDVQRVRQIKDMLPSSIGYGKIRFIITMIEITYGITKDLQAKPDLSEFKHTPQKAPYSFFGKKVHSKTPNVTTVQPAGTSTKRKVPDWMSSTTTATYKRTTSKNKKMF